MTDGTSRGGVPRPILIACAILGAQMLALVAAAGVLLVKSAVGQPASLGRALSVAALALAGAAVLGLCARGLGRLQPAARTPVVVLELLALPVAYSLAFQAGRVGYGGPILIAALAVIYLLFTPPARAALDREPPR